MSAFIEARIGRRCRLFAYPNGLVNDYLPNDYLPHRRPEHGLEAAFGGLGGRITPQTSVWDIPRHVCGYHWKTPEALAALLEAA